MLPQEIERKFLVIPRLWNEVKDACLKKVIKQGYLFNKFNHTVRIRTVFCALKGYSTYLTYKSAGTDTTRTELEFKMPSRLGRWLLTLCDKVIVKERYLYFVSNHRWEVDHFLVPALPQLVAEIELKHENEPFIKPKWAGKEVTGRAEYYNSNIAMSIV